MNRSIAIAGRRIGERAPCFVIAEAGVNHNGDLARALQLIDVAKQAGADAVKFQTFRADRLASRAAPKARYQAVTTAADESQFEMLSQLELSREAHQTLFDHCRRQEVLFLSTPFDEGSADFLDELGVAAFKIPSGEITNLDFLTHVARKGKPVILSTGMASLAEVETALDVLSRAGANQVALLQCVSNYPADPADVNLRAMSTMSSAFGVPVGYSDHTMGLSVALAAVALGACVIEKHYTLSRGLPGPDHRASAEPAELAALIEGIRTVESALGTGFKRAAESEADTAAVARKSLVAVREIPAGSVIEPDAIAALRPGTGLAPAARQYVVGRTTRIVIPAGTMITLEMLL